MDENEKALKKIPGPSFVERVDPEYLGSIGHEIIYVLLSMALVVIICIVVFVFAVIAYFAGLA